MKGTKIARFTRRLLLVSVVVLVSGVVGASSAAADPCPVLDLGCVLEGTTTTAGEVLEETTTTVGGAVEDTTTVVEEVLEETTTTIGDTVEDTLPIDTGGVVPDVDVPGGALPDVDVVIPGEGSLPPSPETPGGGGIEPGPNTEVGPPTVGSQELPTGTIAASNPVGEPSLPLGVIPTVGLPATPADVPVTPLLSGARLVETIAFPLVLILLVAGFLMVQSRIDRNDPKLVLAPVGTEYLTFP